MTPQDDDTTPRDDAARPDAAGPAAAAGGALDAGGERTDAGLPSVSDELDAAAAGSDGTGSELRIRVARSGGVAGIGPQWTVTASEEADVDSWLSLVESCPWDPPEPAEVTPIGGGVDRFVYTIRVFLPTDEER